MGIAITNRDVSAAKQAAEQGPVTITDHGRRSHVLLTAEEHDRLTHTEERVRDRLWARGTENIDLELPERRVEPPRGADIRGGRQRSVVLLGQFLEPHE